MSQKSALEQKKEHARLLFVREKLSQKETALRSGVSEKTLSKWVEQYKWKSERAALTITKENQLVMMYAALNQLNEHIAEREELQGKRFASASEADTIMKYAAAIKKLENDCGVSEIIAVFMEFSSWLRTFNPKAAKETVELFDAFVKSKLK
jgi:transposase